jgi:amidohydrolase
LAELTALRRDIHAHPELAFDENRTAEVVARELERYGLEVHRGIATDRGRRRSARRYRSRAHDRPARRHGCLPLAEMNEFPHHSRYHGKMHACGHDGHTAILLGAARHLAENPDFDGTVFIFQPAEESEGGAAVMIEDGLFERSRSMRCSACTTGRVSRSAKWR